MRSRKSSEVVRHSSVCFLFNRNEDLKQKARRYDWTMLEFQQLLRTVPTLKALSAEVDFLVLVEVVLEKELLIAFVQPGPFGG